MKNTFNLTFFLACAALLSLLQAVPIMAETPRPEAIRVVMDNNYPPYSFHDSNGQLVGIVPDLWRLWQEKTGIRADLEALDWNDAQQRMLAGEYDLIETFFNSEARRTLYDFSKPYARIDGSIFFARAISGIDGYATLEGFSVAVKAGDVEVDALQKRGIAFRTFPSYEAVVRAAVEKKVHVFIMDDPSAHYYLSKLDILSEFKHTKPLYSGELSRAVRKGESELLALVENGFATITPLERQRIDTRWSGMSLRDNAPYLWLLLAVLGGVALLALLLFLWNLSLKRAVRERTAEIDINVQNLHETVNLLTEVEVELRLNEERFRKIFEQAAVGIALIDPFTGRYVKVNQKFCKIVGYTAAEMMQFDFKNITPPEDVAEDLAQIEKIMTGDCQSLSREKRYIHRNKHIVLARVTTSLLDTSKEALSYRLVIIEDITERRNAKRKIEEQKLFLETLIDSVPIPLYSKNQQNVYTMCNRAFEDFFGCSRTEIVGTAINPFAEELESQDAAVMDQDGHETGVFPCAIKGAMALHQVVMYKAPFSTQDGKVSGLIGAILDITELKEREKELEERNVELERFTYMISHDLKSPVVTVKSFLGLLRDDIETGDRERIEEDLRYLVSAADTMGQLLDDLLRFIKVDQRVKNSESMAYKDVVNHALDRVAGSLFDSGISVHFAECDLTLCGDVARLIEIWQNLVENAIKFTAGNLAPRIEIGREETPHGFEFFVCDNGIGIHPDYHEKVFDLFEKLDPQSPGTGLGLALVKRIVEQNGGTVRIESAGLDQGTCFRFTLPGACC